jgi:hypothetical protein
MNLLSAKRRAALRFSSTFYWPAAYFGCWATVKFLSTLKGSVD